MQLHFLGKNCSYKNNFRSELMWFLFPKKSQPCFSWKVHYGKYVKYGWCLFIALLGGQLLASEFCYFVVVNITVTASVLKLRRLHSGSYVYFKSSRLQASNLCLYRYDLIFVKISRNGFSCFAKIEWNLPESILMFWEKFKKKMFEKIIFLFYWKGPLFFLCFSFRVFFCLWFVAWSGLTV